MTKTQENLLQEGTEQVSQPNTKNPSMFFQKNHSKHMIIGDKKIWCRNKENTLNLWN